ncbi:PPK2 family polyphosphate kinase [Parapedobacter tibetensis]|uniref:PPK2 family polyphosphate kinase n=1 Tax=Parapedobacter tibetensis TaxID=2972951 RepID=UPI00214DAEBF|nr:PPK2 family polyphosphate kinase [Parapedobacter tibetensis]
MTSIIEKYCVLSGKTFKLKDYQTDDSDGYEKKEALKDLSDFKIQMQEYQERLYAEDSHSLLIIFQAMDAAGKDGAIEHVMSGVNPQGCQVFSFKQPTSNDYEHDFLWRHYKALPERGRIGIHNRSHYEYVLVCKVHPEYNLSERIPGYRKVEDFDKKFWNDRYESIRQFEAHLSRNGTKILKFFLHVSKDEQKERFLDRIGDKYKNWKFSSTDIEERAHWDTYMSIYEEAIAATATAASPWFIIPADKKWFARFAVGKIITDSLAKIEPEFPILPESQRAKLGEYREKLERE